LKIHYDHEREGWYIESRWLAWLVDMTELVFQRVWIWFFVAAYVVCVWAVISELTRWLETLK
jgi:hypothetical protein